jgi:hypothetical protein
MRKRIVRLVSVALAISVAALAHGNKKHVLGTVAKINPDSLVVQTSVDKSVEVRLTPSTVYISAAGGQEKPAKLSDLSLGDRVVIHATPTGDTLSADEVKFSPPGSAGHSASGHGTKPH